MAPEFDPMPALIIISALVLVVLEIWRRGLRSHLPWAGHALVVAAGAAVMIAPFAYQLPIDRVRLAASGDPAAHAALLDATIRAGLERLVGASALVALAVIVLRRATRRARLPVIAGARARA